MRVHPVVNEDGRAHKKHWLYGEWPHWPCQLKPPLNMNYSFSLRAISTNFEYGARLYPLRDSLNECVYECLLPKRTVVSGKLCAYSLTNHCGKVVTPRPVITICNSISVEPMVLCFGVRVGRI